MIFYWLLRTFGYVRWLLVPPRPANVKRINPHAKCYACGWSDGRLRLVHRVLSSGSPKFFPLIEHTCAVCGCRTYEHPVAQVGAEKLQPAIARDELEKDADAKNWIEDRKVS